MPLFGLGTWRISPGHETEQAVAWALEAGYRDIDTAAAYPNERCVGTALRNSRLARDEVFVTTKWMPVRPNPPPRTRAESRAPPPRLRGPLYLIHWPMPWTNVRGWHGLEALHARGLARAIGVSNYGTDPLARLLVGAARPVAVNQVQFSPVHFRRRLLEFCTDRGIAVEGYSPLDQ